MANHIKQIFELKNPPQDQNIYIQNNKIILSKILPIYIFIFMISTYQIEYFDIKKQKSVLPTVIPSFRFTAVFDRLRILRLCS